MGVIKHTAVLEELFSPDNWKDQWQTKFSRLEEDWVFQVTYKVISTTLMSEK